MDAMVTMTSSRPYLIRAIRDWIQDNGLTPYILVRTDLPGTAVPEAYVENGRIVLNLSDRAIAAYALDDEWLSFDARFGGRNRTVRVPVGAVLAIYARENGEGMVFDAGDGGGDGSGPPSGPHRTVTETGREERPSRPHLELIKG